MTSVPMADAPKGGRRMSVRSSPGRRSKKLSSGTNSPSKATPRATPSRHRTVSVSPLRNHSSRAGARRNCESQEAHQRARSMRFPSSATSRKQSVWSAFSLERGSSRRLRFALAGREIVNPCLVLTSPVRVSASRMRAVTFGVRRLSFRMVKTSFPSCSAMAAATGA